MKKNLKIESPSSMDYDLTLKIVQEYVKQFQTKREKKNYEKSVSSLFTDLINAQQVVELKLTGKNPERVIIENIYKEFFILVKETKTSYNIKIWYAN